MPHAAPSSPPRTIRRGVWMITAGLAALVAAGFARRNMGPRLSYASRAAAQLAPTAHPPVPSRIEDAWLVPTTGSVSGLHSGLA